MTKYVFIVTEDKNETSRPLGVYADEHEAIKAVNIYLKSNKQQRYLWIKRQKIEKGDVFMTFYNVGGKHD